MLQITAFFQRPQASLCKKLLESQGLPKKFILEIIYGNTHGPYPKKGGIMKLWMIISMAILILLCFSLPLLASEKVVYGEDNRLDVIESHNSMHVGLSVSTAGMIDPANLSKASGGYTIVGDTLAQSFSICPGERFEKQTTVAMCSGFLVGPDILITAGHCMQDSDNCAKYRWVFNYAEKVGDLPIVVSEDDIYNCKEVIDHTVDEETMNDYAVVRLDRAVKGRLALKFRTEGKVADNANVMVIGHPSGLPTKISDGAYVRNNDPLNYFVTNLDTFGGNSGSAVFDSDSGLVEGILVRGEQDYEYNEDWTCQRPKKCDMTGCNGEEITRITSVPNLKKIVGDL